MLLKQSNQISYERSIVSTLISDADRAFADGDRALCIDLIREIYGLLDLETTGRVGPDRAGIEGADLAG